MPDGSEGRVQGAEEVWQEGEHPRVKRWGKRGRDDFQDMNGVDKRLSFCDSFSGRICGVETAVGGCG